MNRSVTAMRRALCAAAVLAACASAQRPSSWAFASAPGIQPAAVQHRGKILWFQDRGRVHVFSAFLRAWRSTGVAPGATVRWANDWLLIDEGSRLIAFASMRGVFEPLALSAGAQVLNPATQINDSIVLVRDGANLHAFSGLRGRWVSRAVPPTARIAVQRDVAVVADGANLLGMSALTGAWVAHAAGEDVATVAADGTVGVAEGATLVHGFSAIRNTWSSAPALPVATRSQERDVAIWSNATRALGFSGVRGAFATVQTGQATTITLSDSFAVASSAAIVFHFFSAPRAQWLTLGFGEPATLATGAAVATLVLSDRVVGYSALTGATGTALVAGASISVSATVAAAVGAAAPVPTLFSAMTSRWHAAPPGAQQGLPDLARNAALLRTGSGRTAFSPRSGRFVPLPVGAGASSTVDPNSSLVVVVDGAVLHAFEPRRDVWLSTPVVGGVVASGVWRSTAIAVGSGVAYGFGVQHGALESEPFAGTFVELRASSEVGAVLTGDGVLGFGSVSDLTSHGQFPEFRRMYGRGATIDLHLAAAPGAVAAAAAGIPAAVPTRLPIGDLLLEPQVLVPFPLAAVDAEGRSVLALVVPDDVALAGLELGFQGVVLPPGGAAYLTRLDAVGVF